MIHQKQLFTITETMEKIVEELNANYPSHSIQSTGLIQFILTHETKEYHYHIQVTPNELRLEEGQVAQPTITIRCSFYHWLQLAQKKLNPIWGVITRKLKFEGDTQFLKVLPPTKNRLQLGTKKDPYALFEKRKAQPWQRPQKVLIIHASPRGQRGYTHLITQSFIRGMRQSSVEIEEIYLNKLQIKQCKGCWNCWIKDTGKCILKDDMELVMQKEKQADLVVYSLPLYVDGMPGLLKDYFDRCVTLNYPYMENDAPRIRHPRREKIQQTFAVIGVCGFLDQSNFEALSHHFKAISINQHRPLIAEMYRSSIMYLFNNPLLYFEQRQFLESMEKAGSELIQQGKLSRKTNKRIHKKLTTTKNYLTLSNNFWNAKVQSKELDY